MAQGKKKYIETPQKLWDLFCAYRKEIESTPFKVPDWVGKDAIQVKREHMKTLTMEGFECYVMDHTRISYPDLTEYFEGKNESYSDYFPICSRIKREIRRDQLEKGLAGLANQSITQRINNLVDKSEVKEVKEQPLFPNVSTDDSN